MQIRDLFLAAVCATGVLASYATFAADDNYSVSSGKQGSTVKTPDTDRPQKTEDRPQNTEDRPQKTDTNYDVKKTHDEHIPETEKAAGEAAKRGK